MPTTKPQPQNITQEILRSLTTSQALRLNFLIFLFYFFLALLITFPLILNIGQVFAGYPDSDSYEMARHIWWFKTALQNGGPIFFQPLLGYPDGIAGVSLWANPLQFFPMWLFALFLPLPVAYNLTLLLTMALNGWALYWLLWRMLNWGKWTLHTARAGALVGGLIFMAHPIFQGHLAGGHAGLLVLWPAPLLVYALFKLRALGWWSSIPHSKPLHLPDAPQPAVPRALREVRRSTALWIIFGALCFMLTAGGHALQAIYVLLPLVGLFLLRLIAERNWRGLWRVVVMSVLGSAGLLIFLLPSIIGTLDETDAYLLNTNVRYSTDLLGILAPSFNHPLYGEWPYTHRVLGVNIVEGSAYLGVFTLLLVGVGVWKLRAARWWLLLAAVAWVLSLGPLLKVFDQPLILNRAEYLTYIPLPYALIENLPLLSLARTPGRFTFTVALAAAIMSGYGAAWSFEKLTAYRRGAAAQKRKGSSSPAVLLCCAVLCSCILLDYQSFWPLPTVDADPPQAIYSLNQDDTVRAVFNIPWENVLAAKEALWLQTAHSKPMIAGHVTRQTPVDPAKLTLLQTSLDGYLLDEAGADMIILHKYFDYDGTLYAHTVEKLGAPFYEDTRFALFRAPNAGEKPSNLIISSTTLFNQPISTQANLYLYAPEAEWTTFTGTLHSEREVIISLDGTAIHRLSPDGEVSFSLPIPLAAAGYHTLTVAQAVPCPIPPTDVWVCSTALVSTARLASSITSADFTPTAFEGGITLRGAKIAAQPQTALTVDLWWQFDQARLETDVRFVHVIDSAGELVAQEDVPLGLFEAGEQWVEQVVIALPADLPSGEYRVYTGWYSYPDITPFTVFETGEGRAQIGVFSVP